MVNIISFPAKYELRDAAARVISIYWRHRVLYKLVAKREAQRTGLPLRQSLDEVIEEHGCWMEEAGVARQLESYRGNFYKARDMMRSVKMKRQAAEFEQSRDNNDLLQSILKRQQDQEAAMGTLFAHLKIALPLLPLPNEAVLAQGVVPVETAHAVHLLKSSETPGAVDSLPVFSPEGLGPTLGGGARFEVSPAMRSAYASHAERTRSRSCVPGM